MIIAVINGITFEENITASGYISTTCDLFKIDGKKVCSPTGLKWEEHTLSISWNSASGIQHKINYRVRKKVVWMWSVIGREDLKEIYNILDKKRENTGSTLFNIHTDWITGEIDMEGEWGSPYIVEGFEGMRNLFNQSISFIEPVGFELPTESQLGG